MKINWPVSKTKVLFCEVKPGDAFLYGNPPQLFVRVDSTPPNALGLEAGHWWHIGSNEYVDLVNAEVTFTFNENIPHPLL
jgi:hypothetical protein